MGLFLLLFVFAVGMTIGRVTTKRTKVHHLSIEQDLVHAEKVIVSHRWGDPSNAVYVDDPDFLREVADWVVTKTPDLPADKDVPGSLPAYEIRFHFEDNRTLYYNLYRGTSVASNRTLLTKDDVNLLNKWVSKCSRKVTMLKRSKGSSKE